MKKVEYNTALVIKRGRPTHYPSVGYLVTSPRFPDVEFVVGRSFKVDWATKKVTPLSTWRAGPLTTGLGIKLEPKPTTRAGAVEMLEEWLAPHTLGSFREWEASRLAKRAAMMLEE